MSKFLNILKENEILTEASITKGMLNKFSKDTDNVGKSCQNCGTKIPKYSGRYSKECPNCGRQFLSPEFTQEKPAETVADIPADFKTEDLDEGAPKEHDWIELDRDDNGKSLPFAYFIGYIDSTHFATTYTRPDKSNFKGTVKNFNGWAVWHIGQFQDNRSINTIKNWMKTGKLNEDLDESFDSIYKKYADKDYWQNQPIIDNKWEWIQQLQKEGNKEALKFKSRTEVEQILKGKEIYDIKKMYNNLKDAIENKDVKYLKDHIRHDQKFLKDAFEDITGKKLPGSTR